MAAIEIPSFAPGQPAVRVDASLRQALVACDRARECAVLWFAEVQRRELHRELGFASLELYATQALGFTRDRYFQFKRLAEDLERLPRLREAVETGEIGWTKAQQVARVATPANDLAWVQMAATMGRRELAIEVKRVRAAAKARRMPAAADPPTTVSYRLDGVQLARYEALVERIRKRGLVPREAGREEILLAALEMLAESSDLCRHKKHPSKSPVQIVIRRCPDCERTAVVTSRGEKTLAPAQADAALCDANVREAHGSNRATIPPRVRAEVLARDHHRCTTPGCGATRFLEVHHVKSREQGGTNRLDNLVTLCSRCHRFRHEHD